MSSDEILLSMTPATTSRFVLGLAFAHITDSDAEYLVYVAQQVSMALGITEAK
jgi:hypothetical protein